MIFGPEDQRRFAREFRERIPASGWIGKEGEPKKPDWPLLFITAFAQQDVPGLLHWRDLSLEQSETVLARLRRQYPERWQDERAA